MFGYLKKVGMTRLFVDGKSKAVTVVEFCKPIPLQMKTIKKDGYSAIQIGSVKKRKVSKAVLVHVKNNSNLDYGFRFISEFPLKNEEAELNLDFSNFVNGDLLEITGTTKGKGFTGVIKRHGFHGQPASHGHDHIRAPGSIGTREPQRTLPGKKMAGRSGTVTKTMKKTKVIGIDSSKKLLFVGGSLPGANGGYLKFIKI